MATDYWVSSHFKRWTVDRATLRQARAEDLPYVADPDHLALLGIFFANLVSKLGNRLSMRQRVIATATVFFRRFYLKNAYCEVDPYLVIAACCYVASKSEESPVHIKNVTSEAKTVFSEYGITNFPAETAKLAEMEFYLVSDLECDLIVFHPYRTLMTLVRDSSQSEEYPEEREAGELGAGVDDGPRYWGTGEGKLELPYAGIQSAWFVINDTYRSDICLLYHPHLIAIAALYIVCVINPNIRAAHQEWSEQKQAQSTGPAVRRSTRHTNPTSTVPLKRSYSSDAGTPDSRNKSRVPAQDFVGFFATLNVNLRLVATIAQEIISFYALCNRLKEDFNPSSQGVSSWTRSSRLTVQYTQGTESVEGTATGRDVDSMFLMQLLARMRVERESGQIPALARPAAVNRHIQRAQQMQQT